MHKQFQKFGLFSSKNSQEETTSQIDDKHVKYLYKKNSESLNIPKNSQKRKIKSANDSEKDKFEKRTSEYKSRGHRKVSDDSLRKFIRKTNASETEIFFISPEDIKRHRKKIQQNEKSPVRTSDKKKQSSRAIGNLESERKKTLQRNDLSKFIKEHRSKEDYKFLNKKEIVKLINNAHEEPKDSSATSFLKKFFVFDTKEKPGVIPVKEKHSRRSHRYIGDNKNKTSASFNNQSGSGTIYRKDKMKELEKKTKEKYVDVMYKRDSNKEKLKSDSKQRDIKDKSIKKLELENQLQGVKMTQKTSVRQPSESRITTETKTKPKIQDTSVEQRKKRLDEKVQNISNINTKRHKHCLVKNTFPIIEILPYVTPDASTIEKKKKLKAFKKYYKYFADKDSEVTVSSYPYSDSHKLYQEFSEYADEFLKSKGKHKKSSSRGSELKIQTNVSSIIIEPVPRCEDIKSEEKKKPRRQKSRIPIFNNKKAAAEVARNASPASKSRRKSADLFKFQNKVDEIIKEEETEKHEKVVKPVKNKIQEKHQVPSSTKATQNNLIPKCKEKASNTKSEINDLKLSKASSGSKRSNSDKKSVSSKSRNSSPSPQSTFRKKTSQEGNEKRSRSKSPKLSNDDSGLVSRKTSKKSTKTTLSSKSDTRITKTKKSNRKEKTIEKSSARTSISNSTCGDKSIDSKNGTSFLLTKSYRDDDKWNRLQKRKQYADAVRRSIINKNQKSSKVPPQILEVRYLTTLTPENIKPTEEENDRSRNESIQYTPEVRAESFNDDLPNPCFELVEDRKFKEIFEMPIDDALNEILKENYNFLKKDFTFNLDHQKLSSSSDDLSGNELLSAKNSNDWFDFKLSEQQSLSELSSCPKKSDLMTPDLNLGSQEHIVDSLSAPGSEESGYATVKTRSFFEHPNIKALIHPRKETFFDYSGEAGKKNKGSNSEELTMCSFESKSLQTCLTATSQKSIQIKLLQEEIDFAKKKQDKEDQIGIQDDKIGRNNLIQKFWKNQKFEEAQEVEIANFYYEDLKLKGTDIEAPKAPIKKRRKKLSKVLSFLFCTGYKSAKK